MTEYVREGRVPNVTTIFMILYKGKGLLCASMWKRIGNKGRWLGQAYKENVETILELYLLKKTNLKSANQVYEQRAGISASLTW